MPPRGPIGVAEAFRGVDRRTDQQSISPRHLWRAQNFYAGNRGIADMRLGSSRFNSSQVSGGIGRNIIRYYPAGGTARKIAVFNIATGDIIYYGTDATGALTEVTGGSSLTANSQYLFAEFQGNLYIGNAIELIQVSANGTTRANIGGSPVAPIGYPGGPYRSRLLIFANPTNPTRVSYTDTFTVNTPTDNYITIEHPENPSAVHVFGRDDDQGVFGDLAIFTPTSTWIVRGDFKDIAGGYSLERAEGRLGTLSPLSLVDTPYGLMGLGYDGTTDIVVFLIPTGGGRPIVVSEKIREIEALPRAYRNLACATYFKGWYRLSFVPSGGTVPAREWWADLRSFSFSAPDFNIDWWGPMIGRNVGAMAVQSGSGDASELIAIDGNAGYVLTLDPASTYDDVGTNPTGILESKLFDGRAPLHKKTFAGMIVGAKPTADENVAVRALVDEGAAAASATIVMSATSPVVGETTLVGDDTIVGGGRFREYPKHLSSPLYGNRMSVEVTYDAGRQFTVKRLGVLGVITKRMHP